MKITVLSVFILMLAAGLAMIQMDANTENQFQVLNETEMLATQGFGDCERVVHLPAADGECADKRCYTVTRIKNTPFPYIVAKHVALKYYHCGAFDPNKECFEFQLVDENGKEHVQYCARKHEYYFICSPLLHIKTLSLERPWVQEKPGCFGQMAMNSSS